MHRKYFRDKTKTKIPSPYLHGIKVRCTPKSLGGLSLRKTLPMNQAFIAKLGWKILTYPNNICVKLAKAK